MSNTNQAETVNVYLRPIDATGLAAFAEKGRGNPTAKGTNKVPVESGAGMRASTWTFPRFVGSRKRLCGFGELDG